MNQSKTLLLIFVAILLVYICGLPIDVMEVDAAQYATISSEMYNTGEYLQIYCRGYDYLDKPPFLFWLNQIFFFIFGVHDWSFKIGNLVFVILGLYATFKLGQLLYNKNAGFMAACILGTTQAWFLITQDVKTDGILASTIIYTVWQWKLFSSNKKWKHLLGLSIGIAIGMLTKGPLGFVVPAAIIGADMLIHKQWNSIFNWKYMISASIILCALSPMLYGLYLQYDLHPGKTVSGGQVVDSGLRFYFWTQSFGRITGESKWNNNSSFFYFFPEIAWAFLPWCIFILQSVIHSIKFNFKKNIIPLAGFILPFIALSLSHYKLSHYIFICFPFIALMVANYLSNAMSKPFSKIIGYAIQCIIFIAIPVLGYCFNISWFFILIILATILLGFIIIQRSSSLRLFLSIVYLALSLNVFLNIFVYPSLLKYQAATLAGKEYFKKVPDKKIPFIEINTWSFSAKFYSKTNVKNYGSLEHLQALEKEGEYWLYMPHSTFNELKSTNFKILEIITFDNFPVTRLKIGFINPETRKDYISKTYMVKVYLPEDWKI